MNRRSFLRSLGIGCAAVYLRLAPERVSKLVYLTVDDDFKTVRRSVYYSYPNGKAPLVGLLTLLQDDVDANKPMKWFETTI